MAVLLILSTFFFKPIKRDQFLFNKLFLLYLKRWQQFRYLDNSTLTCKTIHSLWWLFILHVWKHNHGKKARTRERRDLKEISGELVGDGRMPQTRRVSGILPPTNKPDISFRSLHEHCSWLHLIPFIAFRLV